MRTESDKRTGYKTDCSDSISLKNAYKEGKEILAKAGITEADLDAWYLLEYITGVTKTAYYGNPKADVPEEQAEDVTYARRLACCGKCTWYGEHMCRACGCYVQLRAAVKEQNCPYEKWEQEGETHDTRSGNIL